LILVLIILVVVVAVGGMGDSVVAFWNRMQELPFWS
jgi:hypothetical protein